MPITRTPIVDDDHSGTTGTVIDNAWKQQFYDQIDALTVGMAPVAYGTFTPVEHYTGLVMPTSTGSYAKQGRLVVVQIHFVFPSTAGSPYVVWFDGVPFAAGSPNGAGLVQGSGIHRVWHITGASLVAYHPTTGANTPLADMSGTTAVLSGSYLTN